MSRRNLVLGLCAVTLILAACAAGANPEAGVAAPGGDIAGFWPGLWHGLIAPIAFLISLFNDTVNIYEVHNNGNWYNFGFILGAGVWFGGGSQGARMSKKRA
jgi:hypothetical protein